MRENDFGIIIQARTGSSRLKKKMLLPFGEESSLLGFIISKISKSVSNPIVLATSDTSGDKILGDIAAKYNVPTHFGSENDVLARFVDAAKENSFKKVIRICADNPFISTEYLNDLIYSFEKETDSDYVSFQKQDGTPVMKSHLGFYAEAIRVDALEKANTMTDSNFYHEHVTNFIYENKNHFKVKFLPVAEQLDRNDYRLTLDTEEDYQMLLKIEQKLRNKYENKYGPVEVLHMVEELDLRNRMVSIINENTK